MEEGKGIPPSERMRTHHLILIREIDEQLAASGCCGRLSGDLARWERGGCAFPERRAGMERAGAVYRALRERFGSGLRLSVVDPRNQIALLPMILADACRNGVPLWRALRTLFRLGAESAVLDGELLFPRRLPEPREAIRAVVERTAC